MSTRRRRRAFLGSTPVALASIGERPPVTKRGIFFTSELPERDPQEYEYELALGRPWTDEPPAPADFGAPTAPPAATSSPETLRAFYAAHDEWKTTESCKRWRATYDLWEARRDQFQYSRRKRNATTVLETAKEAV